MEDPYKRLKKHIKKHISIISISMELPISSINFILVRPQIQPLFKLIVSLNYIFSLEKKVNII